MLDKNDEKIIRSVVYDGLNHIIENVILPEFKKIDKRFDAVDEKFRGVEKRLDEVDGHLVEIDQDMLGLKYRLGEVEKKVETLIDSSVEIKFHDRRISKLESSIA